MRHMRMEQRPKWSVTAVFVHVATGCVLQWSALVSKESGHLMNPPRKIKRERVRQHTGYLSVHHDQRCLKLWILAFVIGLDFHAYCYVIPWNYHWAACSNIPFSSFQTFNSPAANH